MVFDEKNCDSGRIALVRPEESDQQVSFCFKINANAGKGIAMLGPSLQALQIIAMSEADMKRIKNRFIKTWAVIFYYNDKLKSQ